jgi:hypothetical protein
MYNISSVKENGEMMLKMTPENHFAKPLDKMCILSYIALAY